MAESPSQPVPTNDPPDSVLRGAQNGDPRALEALARWCLPRAYRWALVQTGDADEADDVAQDVVVALPGRLQRFRGESRFSTWLFRITANAAGDRRRTQTRRAGTLARWFRPPAPVDEERRRLDALYGEQVADLVRLLMNGLPPQQRLVFDLSDLQHFGAAEIAQMLELEPATVRSHLMRARRTLREWMLAGVPSLTEDRP